MKTKLLPIAVLFISTLGYSQVGINTTTPQSTMDIAAKNSIGTSTLVDGLLIPRVDRQRAVNMASVQPSTLIYVNNIATGSAIGQGSNIDSIGFYYFDGSTSKWTKLNSGGMMGDPTPDAFIDDTANTMVKLGATSSGAARSVGSDFVIKDNGRVGLGTSAPIQQLDVRGSGRFESDNTALDMISAGTAAANINLIRNNGGTNLSSDNLVSYVDFKGRINNTNNSSLGAIVSTYKGNGTNNLSSLDFRTSGNGNIDMMLDPSGNLGIGTSTPAQKLEVNGNIKFNAVPNASSVDNSDRIMVLQSDGTGKKVPLSSLQPANTYTPRGVFVASPSNPVTYALNQTYPGGATINNIDLNYAISVHVPANTSSLIIFNYSVPTGLTDSTGNIAQMPTSGFFYQGIRFVRNGVEAPTGSRKFRQNVVSTISGTYTETYNNNTSSPVYITFRLDGYLELAPGVQFPSGTFARFNMNKASGENYNWGKGTLVLQQFDKPL
ncbi:hypothetical protein J2786_000516 [Chryseobacterium vietnamense]|uniref:Uncharacterized protein n=1 Tax=Chryseobacterium vietnamense TaxID=866785 RepID=A0ACC6J3I6_9FLAO|nr:MULTISPECIES: hypothetical protein [Chryseobacterium]MDR6457423.1 hypothetical protein [Chryseobacterium vietnamense]